MAILESKQAPVMCHLRPPTRRIAVVKDLLLVSTSIFLTSMAYCGLVNLQTSLNADDDLGNKTLTVVYFFAFASTMFLTSLSIRKLGLRWTLVVSVLSQTAFSAANFWPRWYVMYVGGAISGLGSGPMWSAANAYLVAIGKEYVAIEAMVIESETTSRPKDVAHFDAVIKPETVAAKSDHVVTDAAGKSEAVVEFQDSLVKSDVDGSELVISRFFGVFYAFARLASVTGSTLASLVFVRPSERTSTPVDSVPLEHCGASYCYQSLLNGSVNGTVDGVDYRPSDVQVHLLFGIYLACSVLAVPTVALIRPVNSDDATIPGDWKSDLLGTFRAARRLEQVLLTPLSLYGGVTYAFSTADYILGFVTCISGIDVIGYVMSSFGAAAALGSIVFGPLLKYLGRSSTFLCGFLCNTGVLLALVFWTPPDGGPLVLYTFAALLGVTYTLWVSQLAAFIGFLFADHAPERAFSCFLLYQMLGNCAWHGFNYRLCLDQQIFVMLALLSLGFVGYASVEVLLARRREAAPEVDRAPHGESGLPPDHFGHVEATPGDGVTLQTKF